MSIGVSAPVCPSLRTIDTNTVSVVARLAPPESSLATTIARIASSIPSSPLYGRIALYASNSTMEPDEMVAKVVERGIVGTVIAV